MKEKTVQNLLYFEVHCPTIDQLHNNYSIAGEIHLILLEIQLYVHRMVNHIHVYHSI
jgi:hypothetical protein